MLGVWEHCPLVPRLLVMESTELTRELLRSREAKALIFLLSTMCKIWVGYFISAVPCCVRKGCSKCPLIPIGEQSSSSPDTTGFVPGVKSLLLRGDKVWLMSPR